MAQRMIVSGASSAAYYIGDALQTAFWLFKKPLGVLIFVMGLAVLCNYVVGKIGDMLSPLCLVPVISTTMFCVHRTTFSPTVNKVPHLADLDKLIELHGNFGGLLDTNADAGAIGTKLLQAEIATRDLVTLVRVSDLRSRDMLAGALMQFVEDAKRTGEGLHSLNAKVNGAVDRITAMNDYAMSTISAAAVDGSPLSWIATIFAFHSGTPAVIVQSYRDVMETLAAETERALLEASVSAANLERLQEHLLTIHEICMREGLSLSAARAKLLSELWSILGGNRDALRKAEGRLALLAEVDQYRKQALDHVVMTRDVLKKVAADVEELRDRSAAPQIVGERVPVEVLIRSIGQGIERLQEGRQRASGGRHVMNRLLAASNNDFGGKRV
ncbi:uncharacterized protein B0H18DRAFT_875116 [Fomitopsis serialis]|uniref:uncharacterized protein n=1 Tax=Fomitopsis serialis TaxID=139415 RepID=UPI002008ADF6|nr:uncharacterized protein B0H18DRAFT_875116 [Neoantrodia serialis]KAH9928145.1 hypothetical protein B0H18DRAFT_875116 [Neoantrodia serialis]